MLAKHELAQAGSDTNPFIDPDCYQAYVADREQAFRRTLAERRTAGEVGRELGMPAAP